MEGILPHSQKESVFTCYLGPKEVLLKLLCFCLFCLALLERVSRNLGYAYGFYGCWGYTTLSLITIEISALGQKRCREHLLNKQSRCHGSVL